MMPVGIADDPSAITFFDSVSVFMLAEKPLEVIFTLYTICLWIRVADVSFEFFLALKAMVISSCPSR